MSEFPFDIFNTTELTNYLETNHSFREKTYFPNLLFFDLCKIIKKELNYNNSNMKRINPKRILLVIGGSNLVTEILRFLRWKRFMFWVNGIHEPRTSRLALFVKGTACQIQYPISTAMKNAFINNCSLYLWMRFWCTDRHQKSAIVDFIFVTRLKKKKRIFFILRIMSGGAIARICMNSLICCSLVFALACANYK